MPQTVRFIGAAMWSSLGCSLFVRGCVVRLSGLDPRTGREEVEVYVGPVGDSVEAPPVYPSCPEWLKKFYHEAEAMSWDFGVKFTPVAIEDSRITYEIEDASTGETLGYVEVSPKEVAVLDADKQYVGEGYRALREFIRSQVFSEEPVTA